MNNSNLSKCANPECAEQFRRLGEGKLYVRPQAKSAQGLTQKAVWLCPSCSAHFDMRYDRRLQQYHLVRRRNVA